jgi:hypothetical protein
MIKKRTIPVMPSIALLKLAIALILVSFIACLGFGPRAASAAQSKDKKDKKKEKKEEKIKPEPFKIEQHTKAMGLHSIGPVSPDRKTVLLIAKKPDTAPNLYRLN